MIVTYVYADRPFEWNSSNWRCVLPARAINRTGTHSANMVSIIDFEKNTPEANFFCTKSDVIVVERNYFGDAIKMILYWKARGKVIIGNFDDAYQLMHPSNKSYPFWYDGVVNLKSSDGKEFESIMKPPPLVQFKWALRIMHGITMPSRILANDWAHLADTYYVPNYCDVPFYLKAGAPEHEGIIIGWGGSLSHLQSFTDSGLPSALRRVCKARDNVRVQICGDRRVFDKVDLPEDKKIFQDYVPYDKWANVVANFDIGLAPLHGVYDNRRSWIKPLEYMLLNIPWVASDFDAYEELKPYGKIIKNTSDEWETAILDIIDHYDDYKKKVMGEPHEFALAQDANKNVNQILSVYAEIAEKNCGIKLEV